MNLRNYRTQALIFAIWIPVVLALFRVISERQVAAVIAGSGFVLIPLLVLKNEFAGKKNRIHMAVIAFFLMTSAIPVLFLRISNWGAEFATLELAGIPAKSLHGFSNVTYLAMLASAVYRAWRARSEK